MDNEVFITKNSYKKILPLYNKKLIPSTEALDSIYEKNLRHILSIPEMCLLYIERECYKNEQFFLDNYNKVKPNGSNNFVFTTKSPSYHYDMGCNALCSTFTNFEIPDEISNLGDEAVEDFREFFQENRNLLKTKPDLFMAKLKIKFRMKKEPRHIEFANSGISKFKNIGLEELDRSIKTLLFDAEKYRTKSPEIEKLIKNLGYGTHRAEDAKKPGTPLYIWHNEYKEHLKYLLREYFRVKLNPELKFSGKLLEQLGFKACANCSPIDLHMIF